MKNWSLSLTRMRHGGMGGGKGGGPPALGGSVKMRPPRLFRSKIDLIPPASGAHSRHGRRRQNDPAALDEGADTEADR